MADTIKSVSTLKSIWIDGYSPVGSDFSDVFTTMVANTVGSGDVNITSATGIAKINGNTIITDNVLTNVPRPYEVYLYTTFSVDTSVGLATILPTGYNILVDSPLSGDPGIYTVQGNNSLQLNVSLFDGNHDGSIVWAYRKQDVDGGDIGESSYTYGVYASEFCSIVPLAQYPVISSSFATTASFAMNGGGSGGIIVLDSGLNSTVRCGNNNCASGNHSAVLSGCGNTSSAYYSFIGGGSGNNVCANSSTISGGNNNSVTDIFSTIGGGGSNTVCGRYSVIGGGVYNTASSQYSIVAGGRDNQANGDSSAVTGGCCSRVNGSFSTIGGGLRNTVNTNCSVIGGGSNNTISGGDMSSIIGGNQNVACGQYSSVIGGKSNTSSGYSSISGGSSSCSSGNYSIALGYVSVSTTNWSTVSGGSHNTACGQWSTVSGGYCNKVGGSCSSVVGGVHNTIFGDNSGILSGQCNSVTGSYSGISSGEKNIITGNYSNISSGQCNLVEGNCSSIVGGWLNSVSSNCSSIIGGRNNSISASFDDSFIIGSNLTADSRCTTFVNNLNVKNTLTAFNILGYQAGRVSIPFSSSFDETTITVPLGVPFDNTNYIVMTSIEDSGNGDFFPLKYRNKTTSSFDIYIKSHGTGITPDAIGWIAQQTYSLVGGSYVGTDLVV